MTGQYPKRREPDTKARRRVLELEERRRAWLASCRPLTPLEARLIPRPRYSHSGRLI